MEHPTISSGHLREGDGGFVCWLPVECVESNVKTIYTHNPPVIQKVGLDYQTIKTKNATSSNPTTSDLQVSVGCQGSN